MKKNTQKNQAPVLSTEDINKVMELPADTPPSTIADLWARIDTRLKTIEDKFVSRGNGRGPMSTRPMTADDAARIITGDLSTKSIKECAKELGLSYGQVYSARNGYTFKTQVVAKTPVKK